MLSINGGHKGKNMKKLVLILLALCFCVACGSGSVTPSDSSITATISTPENTTNVAVNTDIVVTLTDDDSVGITEPESWATVFTLKATDSATNLCTGYSYVAETKLITCTLTENLAANTEYSAVLSGLTDANNKTIADASKTFTTAAALAATTVKDGADVEIAPTGSINVWPTTFTTTFSKAIEPTTFTDENVTLSCTLPAGNTTPQPSLAIGTSPCTDTACTFSVEDAWRFALLHCTLTLTTGIEATDGTTLTSNATYKFLNACAVNDDFNAISSACWTNVYTGLPPILSDWASIDELETFNLASSSFDFATSGNKLAAASKPVTVSADGLTMIYRLDSVSGIDTTGDGGYASRVGTLFNVGSNPNSSGTSLFAGVINESDTQSCIVAINNGASSATASCPTGHTYDIKAVVDASGTVTGFYQTDGDGYVALTGSLSTLVNPESYTHLMWLNLKTTPAAAAAAAGSIYTEGVTSETQY